MVLLQDHFPDFHIIFVPACCTGKLQPCDLSLQKPFKAAWNDYGLLYVQHVISEQEKAGVPFKNMVIDLSLPVSEQL
jgi:hypothetical protein